MRREVIFFTPCTLGLLLNFGQGALLLSEPSMLVMRLRCAIVIRVYISEQEVQAEAIKKKASDQKRSLLKAHKALKRVYEKAGHIA